MGSTGEGDLFNEYFSFNPALTPKSDMHLISVTVSLL